ncbi:D-aminoacyl-tRNA deacylase [Natranaerofaba carboxydovora]|uniref:D-aminoacyl-tRNA deacylase n=1 Tax=Natranaerofaba carboxydovora TaxID=2742683 RepID=UPI001F12CA56|nr:D-aminoacyl-tRNA deacylase [Natranaerofaba carboxydovora]UMZ73244.1 D-aminoacyl-tRNA deacylase [Natranaerofaba carboxydovora]
MRAVLQRVKRSSVKVNDEEVGEVGYGLNVLLGIEEGDDKEDIEYMVDKVVNLRIFEDENGKMNLSVLDVEGELLVISQFTLLGDARKGRRPNFMKALSPDESEKIYQVFCETIREKYNLPVKTGTFQEYMEVEIINDGPVTLLLDSNKNF